MKALLSSASALIFLFLLSIPAFASTPSTFKLDQKDFLLQTSAGKTLNENINVQNSTGSKQTLLVSFEGYRLPENQIINQTFLFKHNIDFALLPAQKIDLEAFGSNSISIVLSPPDTYPSGDYYGTLTLKNSDEVQKVSFTVRILGQLKESVEIKEITNDENFLIYQVANSGTIASSFSIKSKLSGFLSQEKVLNSSQEIIRSGEILTIKINHGQLLPSFFQTENTLEYGAKETSITKLFSFWVNPELFVVSFLTLFTSLLLYLVFRRKQP